MSGGPKSTFSYTTITKPEVTTISSGQLSPEERGCLIFYESGCTTFTIVFNSYLIYVVICKLHVSKNFIYIPVLTAACLGLFHGICCDFFTAISLINKEWIGSLDWCGTVALLHKYIVYSIIYCQIVVSFEVAYFVSHPHYYSRTSRQTKMGVTFATFIAVSINFPILICQFFFIKPSNISEVYPVAFAKFDDKFYFYDKLINICFRFYFPGTLDYKIIINYILTTNVAAVALVILSYAAVVRVVIKGRSLARGNIVGNLVGSEDNKKRIDRYKKQNKKIAMISILTTSLVLLPWLPTFVISIIDGADNTAIQSTLGIMRTTRLRRASQCLFYLLPWVFPLMTILGTPAISRASKDIVISINYSDHNAMKLPGAIGSRQKSRNTA